MSSAAGATFQDKTLNKVALCSAVFAGFAYVGYSYARTAFCRKLTCKNEDDDRLQVSKMVFRRLSQTTQTDALLGNLDIAGNSGKLIIRPKTVQERIRELNLKAQQFTDAFIAIQSGNGRSSSNALTRSYAVHGPTSVQCSPWHSPRLLSPVDIKHLIPSKSTENLTCIPPDSSPSRPNWVRKSLKKKRRDRKNESEIQQKIRLENEAMSLYKSSNEELHDSLDSLRSGGRILTPYEAKSLVALLYSRDKDLLDRTLVTIANCAAFTVNLDFLREVGCIHRLCALLQDPEVRLSAVQTLGNVILSEENIRQAKDCIPLLMEFAQNETNEGALQLASLVVLTNLATTCDWHEEFCPLLKKLYQMIDSSNSHIQLQSLRLLVNLSCNHDMIPSLLAAEGPRSLSNIVTLETPDAILLRTLLLLSTLASSVKKHNFDPSADLPLEVKAPSPETIIDSLPSRSSSASCLEISIEERFARLFGVGVRDKLATQSQALMTKHTNEEIRRVAAKLYESLTD